MVENLLMKTIAMVRARAIMYKSVVQRVHLYGSDSWVVTDKMLKVMEGFHHQVAWGEAGMSSRQVGEGGWEWSLVAEALEATGLWSTK